MTRSHNPRQRQAGKSVRRPGPPGRIGAAPWFLASLGIILSFTLVRSFQRGVPEWLPAWVTELSSASGTPATVRDLRGPGAETLAGWSASTSLGQVDLSIRLVPYHAFPFIEEYRSQRLREKLGLESGALFRLIVERVSPGPDDRNVAVHVTGFRVLDGKGVVLRDLASIVSSNTGSLASDPLLALLVRPGSRLEPGSHTQLVAWGAAPGPDAHLELFTDADEGATTPAWPNKLDLPLEPMEFLSRDLPRSLVLPAGVALQTQAAEPEDARDVRERVFELEAALERERARVARLEEQRQKREEYFLEFQKAVASLPLGGDLRGSNEEQAQESENPAPAEEVPPSPEAMRAARELERTAEIAASIRTLFKLEGLFALDLLEVGGLLLSNEESDPYAVGFGVGPVIFRTLDGRGRLTGSLYAERLHLEGSRSARTLTIVLSRGYESHQRIRTPFSGDERRISLPFVDPDHWRERLPELFGDADFNHENDDGSWDLGALRRELNELLAQASDAGWYRLHGVGGVQNSTMNDVHLEDYDANGHRERRIFADHLSLRIGEEGISLFLEDGAVHDSSGVHPFRDGVHRIYLPRADPAAWRAARVPIRAVGGDSVPDEDQ